MSRSIRSSIGEYDKSANALFDGIFEAKGAATEINLGGTLGGLSVDITKLEGPSANPAGWTELTYDQQGSQINEWNGTTYVAVASTLTDIAAGGTVDVQQGSNYDTTKPLSVDAAAVGGNGMSGMLNLQAGTVSTGGLTINGGVVQGYATITGDVTNNGTLEALGGRLVLAGNLTGTGAIGFDQDLKPGGTLTPTGATLEVHGVDAGQTVTMNGDDTLQLDSRGAFLGTLSAKTGDTIILQGITATSAVINNTDTLVITDAAGTAASIKLSGSYSGEGFNLTTAGGNTDLLLSTQSAPVVGGFPANQTGSDNAALAPFTGITVSDPDPNAALSASIMLTNAGVATDADGVLAGTGLTKTNPGTYTLAATTAAALKTELAALMFTPTDHQVPPGNSVVTNFALTVADGGAMTGANTSISIAALNNAPAITALPATQFAPYGANFTPFTGVTITDPDSSAATSAAITLTSGGTASDADGVLSGGAGFNKTGVGTYTLSATTPANLSTELRALTFDPLAPQATPGSNVATGFSLTVADGNATATATTSVTTTTPDTEFDAAYYLKQNPDVAAAGVDPLTHYETYGWQEGRNPDAYFNTTYYLNQNPDVAAAGVDPLLQYRAIWLERGPRSEHRLQHQQVSEGQSRTLPRRISTRSLTTFSTGRLKGVWPLSRSHTVSARRIRWSTTTTISRKISMWPQLALIRSPTTTRSAGTRGATRMPCSTPPITCSRIRTSKPRASIPCFTTRIMAGRKVVIRAWTSPHRSI